MNANRIDTLIETKMHSAGVDAPTIRAFLEAVHKVMFGETGLIPEQSIKPVESLPHFDELGNPAADESALLNQLVLIKLNGGLGTSMGLDGPKSLIPVKKEDSFLDFIVRQLLCLRQRTNSDTPAFLVMNSFNTQRDTIEYLRKYPELAGACEIDFLQNKVPKIDPKTFEPIAWPENPELEWCPPGHGDLYPSLMSGPLRRLLSRDIKYLFVSNSDNLGATVDLKLVNYFARSGLSFLMEVAERTAADRKGGHLAQRRSDRRLILRESAQCPKEDEPRFQDLGRHRFFNTNNLWIRLDHLNVELEKRKGTLPLPLIKNLKSVDPKRSDTPKVLQLESAMGAAIECFAHSGAIVVPRSRFSPVKTTSDLLGLRSDAYRVTDDFRLILDERRGGRPPVIDLDSPYKLLTDFESFFAKGPPSLIECDLLKITGKVKFPAGVFCRGKIEVINPGPEPKEIKPGLYTNASIEL